MKKILITGAGSGLGKALALRYAQQAAEVCVADVDSVAGQAVADQIVAQGGQAFFLACDITKQWDVDKLSMTLAERWQSLDMLINNAGVATAGAIESESLEQWQWVLEINLLGQVRMTKACLALLRNSQSSERDIVYIASQAGITPAPGMGSYSVTKAAVVSLAETAHLELAPEGIHVSVVCPAFFDTNLNQSLRSDDAAMQTVVNKMIKKSGVSADSIAEKIQAGVAARKFMVVTHKDGRKAYRMKRFMPIERYLHVVKQRTKKYITKRDSE